MDFAIKVCGLYSLAIFLLLTGCRDQLTEKIYPASEQGSLTDARYPVAAVFLQTFEQYGGVASFGEPLTEEIVVEGWRVQYFEKARLEVHPENEPAYRVTVGWLGDLLHRRRPPIPPQAIPPSSEKNRQYFPQTGHILSGDFLQYFETYGGSVRFGWPISEPFIWQGRITQDFQSARFFWTPDQTPPVILEDIGRVHLESIK